MERTARTQAATPENVAAVEIDNKYLNVKYYDRWGKETTRGQRNTGRYGIPN